MRSIPEDHYSDQMDGAAKPWMWWGEVGPRGAEGLEEGGGRGVEWVKSSLKELRKGGKRSLPPCGPESPFIQFCL